MTRLRIVIEYDADPVHYRTDNPLRMAEIDTANVEAHPEWVVSALLSDAETKVYIEPVPEEQQ